MAHQLQQTTMIQWKWKDDRNTWQPYDDATNAQIEKAYNSGIPSIKLTNGSYFSKYENQIYTVIFKRNKSPIECVQRNKQTNACRVIKREHKLLISQQSISLLPQSAILQVTQRLVNMDFASNVINDAFKIFNTKYNQNSPILTNLNDIINGIMEIIDKHHLNEGDDEAKYGSRNVRSQDPYFSQYEIGDWIEIYANNVWIPAEIIKTESLNDTHVTGLERAKIISVEYEDTKTLQPTTLKLHGLRDKNRFRVLGTGFYSDSHTFNFEYMANDTRNKASNAKHPSAYINRKCFKCKGKGTFIYKKKKLTNHKSVSCRRCGGDGIYKQPFTLTHDKCNGSGCDFCKGTGKFPYALKCKFCKGTGVFQRGCNDEQKSPSPNKMHKTCNKCVGGYFINKIVGFVPKREGGSKAHGNGKRNVIRLYHTTNKAGADGIKEFGVMFRGQTGAYGGGIYFAVSPQMAKERARKAGYLVIADVYVGKCKEEAYVSPNMDFMMLNKMGYDSIKGSWSQKGVEYVVYCWDQVWVHVVIPFNKVDFSKLI